MGRQVDTRREVHCSGSRDADGLDPGLDHRAITQRSFTCVIHVPYGCLMLGPGAHRAGLQSCLIWKYGPAYCAIVYKNVQIFARTFNIIFASNTYSFFLSKMSLQRQSMLSCQKLCVVGFRLKQFYWIYVMCSWSKIMRRYKYCFLNSSP